MKQILLTLALLAPTLAVQAATTIIINPSGGYLGGIHMLETCTFDFGGGTTLTKGTGIMTHPHNVIYGAGTILSPGSGIQCDLCKIKNINWDRSGQMIVTCDMVNNP